MAKQAYSRREILRLTGKLAVTVGAGSIMITAPACGGGEGGGLFGDCEFVRSETYSYYGSEVIYNVFYCGSELYGPGVDCFYSGYGDGYTCYETRYVP